MTRIPGGREVDRLLRRALIALKGAVKQSNQKAAKLVAKGNYGGGEAFVEAARKIPEFRARLESLRTDWRSISVADSSLRVPKSERTPLWGYYKPILAALAHLGGEATLPQLQAHLTPQATALFKAGDLGTDGKGRPHWQVMVKRARRPMVKEGWIEAKPSNRWLLTEEGQRAAISNKS